MGGHVDMDGARTRVAGEQRVHGLADWATMGR